MWKVWCPEDFIHLIWCKTARSSSSLVSLLQHNFIKLLPISQMPSVADNFFPFVCHTDRRGVERFLYHGQCRDNCPPGHYHLEHSCVPCPSQCEVCLNSSHCKRCFRGYYLTQNMCQKHSCREGKHPSVGDNTWWELLQKSASILKKFEIHSQHTWAWSPQVPVLIRFQYHIIVK